MRVLVRLLLVVILIAVVAGGGYWLVTNSPALRNLIDISVVPGQPTAITDPTDVAVLPTAVPPATAPPSPLPPTPADCVSAASVSAGGESVRRNAGQAGNAQAAARRALPQGRRAQINLPPGRIRNQALIEFTPESTHRERFLYIRSIGARPRRNIERLNTIVVEFQNDIDPATLPPSPVVVSIQADYPVAAALQRASNDPLTTEQWALPVIGAPAVWPALPPNTPPVTVAVIDSGICLNHPDLAGRVVAGWDFIEGDNQPQDEFGHGCGVAGVIAANANNGVGIAGVAPNARIMPLRVLDANGIGSFSDVAAALVYATDSGAQIINMSLAGPATNDIVRDAIEYAAARGVVLVGAAGNGGQQTIWYPAAYDAVLAVGSVDPTLERSDFSNFGPGIDLVAPGRDIYTTNAANDYQTMSGTSFAAPQVSGVAALAMAFNTPVQPGGGIVFISPPAATC